MLSLIYKHLIEMLGNSAVNSGLFSTMGHSCGLSKERDNSLRQPDIF